jgi:hypothetical protein
MRAGAPYGIREIPDVGTYSAGLERVRAVRARAAGPSRIPGSKPILAT